MKLNLKALVPHLLVVVALYLVAVVYFRPEIFEGKSLAKDDIMRYEGGSKEVRDFNATHDEPTLWTGRMFGGMPVFLLHAQYPDQPIAAFDKLFKGLFFLKKDVHVLLALLLCSFIALAAMGISPYIAGFAAAAFGFSTYNLILIDVGHMTKAWAIAYSPLVLAGMYLIFKEKRWAGIALFTLALALELRANHLQITYYLAFIGVIYSLTELLSAVKEGRLKSYGIAVALLATGAFLALGANAGRILVTAEYSQYTQRGKAELKPKDAQATPEEGLSKDYAFNWSQGKGETLTLLIPNFYGGSSMERLSPKSKTYEYLKQAADAGQLPPAEFAQMTERSPWLYRGDQPFTNAPIYAGAVVCFLFVLAFMLLDFSTKAWLASAFGLMVLFAWGKNFETFNYLMFDYFPMFNKFRAVSMALSLAIVLMMIGGALALQKIADTKQLDTLRKPLLTALGITGGFCALVYLLGGMMPLDAPNDGQFGELVGAVKEDRLAVLRSDALRSLFFIALAGGALYAFLLNKVSAMVAIVVVGLSAFSDVWMVGKRYLNDGRFSTGNTERGLHTPTPADEAILKDKDPSYRVLNLNNTFQEAETSYHHRSIGGYFSAKLRRYQDLIEWRIDPEMQQMLIALQKGSSDSAAFRPTKVLNMLNMRYLKYGDEASNVIKNPMAYGAAWLVSELKTVNTPDEEMNALAQLPLDSVAVADAQLFPQAKAGKYATAGSIALKEYQPNKLVYESQTTEKGFAVFSEIYYPNDWKVSIDGQPAQHIRVNYVLRGMEIPAGKHTITFVFDPDTYRHGSTITQICSILVGLLVIGAVVMSVRKKS
jgi:hypothetical protein